MKKSTFILCICNWFCVTAAVWHVGAMREYKLPSQIQSLVHDSDTIYLDSGEYINDATKWNNKNLKVIGLGQGNSRTILKFTGYIPNGKGIFVFENPGACDNAYIENIVFDGATVTDDDGANGAGIRYQANNLTVVNCKFMNCQNGILEGHGSVTASNVTVLNSEFQNNGYPSQDDATYAGYEHHLYVSSSADTLIIKGCYFHHPRGQANSIKTRAQRSFILYNFIDEEDKGYGSWEINIAQGGLNIIMGNIIIQGPAGANHGIISYDEATNPLQDFYFVNNTVINRYQGKGRYFNITPLSGISTFKVYNNIFSSVAGGDITAFGANTPTVIDSSHNVLQQDYLNFGFSDPTDGDFHLTSKAISALDRGIDAGFTKTGYPLTPDQMYHSHLTVLYSRSIAGRSIDPGAYEYAVTTATNHLSPLHSINIFPNPSQGIFHLQFQSKFSKEAGYFYVFNASGQKVFGPHHLGMNEDTEFNLNQLSKGVYWIHIKTSRDYYGQKIILH
jgi:hypothetical protein